MKRWWQFWKEDAPPAVDPAAGCAFKAPPGDPYDEMPLQIKMSYSWETRRWGADRDEILYEMKAARCFAAGKRRGIDYAPVVDILERPREVTRYEG